SMTLEPLMATACSDTLSLLPITRPPPSSLFPYTTLFRSPHPHPQADLIVVDHRPADLLPIRRAGQPHHYHRDGLTAAQTGARPRSEEHTSELQSRENLVCRLLLEKKNRRERCKR